MHASDLFRVDYHIPQLPKAAKYFMQDPTDVLVHERQAGHKQAAALLYSCCCAAAALRRALMELDEQVAQVCWALYRH